MKKTTEATIKAKADRRLTARKRTFNIVQYEVNPITGQSLNFGLSNIKNLVRHKSIILYAYIRHDKDEYTEDDVERMQDMYNITVKIGDIKPPHWHIVIYCGNTTITLKMVAKWLGINDDMAISLIKTPQEFKQDIHPDGKGAFIDCVAYLPHNDIRQQLKAKQVYADSEVTANFDWRSEVNAYNNRKNKYGTKRPLQERDWFRNEIFTGSMSLYDLKRDHKTVYTADMTTLDKLRLKYLESAPLPAMRINYYVEGDGGVGKGYMSRAIARSFYPDLTDEQIFFEVSCDGTGFLGYDGQPVIIYNEFRAVDLLYNYKSSRGVFDCFDTTPTRSKYNVKYGSASLINTINIVNSVESYGDFLDGLVGEYIDKKTGVKHTSEDKQKKQSYRRFPLIFRVREQDFDMLINRGFIKKGTYFEYEEYRNIIGSFQKVAEILKYNRDLGLDYERRLLQPVVDIINDTVICANDDNPYADMTIDDLLQLDDFKNAGIPRIETLTDEEKAAAEQARLFAYFSDGYSDGEIADIKLDFKKSHYDCDRYYCSGMACDIYQSIVFDDADYDDIANARRAAAQIAIEKRAAAKKLKRDQEYTEKANKIRDNGGLFDVPPHKQPTRCAITPGMIYQPQSFQ